MCYCKEFYQSLAFALIINVNHNLYHATILLEAQICTK